LSGEKDHDVQSVPSSLPHICNIIVIRIYFKSPSLSTNLCLTSDMHARGLNDCDNKTQRMRQRDCMNVTMTLSECNTGKLRFCTEPTCIFGLDSRVGLLITFEARPHARCPTDRPTITVPPWTLLRTANVSRPIALNNQLWHDLVSSST
jgi:hypothetical protein